MTTQYFLDFSSRAAPASAKGGLISEIIPNNVPNNKFSKLGFEPFKNLDFTTFPIFQVLGPLQKLLYPITFRSNIPIQCLNDSLVFKVFSKVKDPILVLTKKVFTTMKLDQTVQILFLSSDISFKIVYSELFQLLQS